MVEWLRAPLESLQPKEPFLARLFFAAPLGVDGILALLDEREAMIREGLDQLRGLAQSDGDLDAVLRSATLNAGLQQGEAEIEWLHTTRRMLEEQARR